MNLIVFIPAMLCVCMAVLNAIRRNWKDMAIYFLLGIIYVLSFGYVVQTVRFAHVQGGNLSLQRKVTELEKKLKDKESNQRVEHTR